jgi:16S rRNA (guanine966-N2)-methyltransferase
MRIEPRTTLLRQDALRPAPLGQYDLVFLDPPYGKQMGEAALPPWLAHLTDDALIVWEESTPPTIPQGLESLDQRRYGDTIVTILRKA